jgi:hypothetical protein
MSANLVENKHAKHGVEDDLKSSFYVIFWVALMYTQSYLTTPARALLTKEVFEAEEIDGTGSSTKSAFLISRRQLAGDVFVGRKALDRLIFALAELFARRYVVITDQDQEVYDKTYPCLASTEGTPTHAVILMNLNANPVFKKKAVMQILRSHAKIIAIYNEYLATVDTWPTFEVPNWQDLGEGAKRKPQEFFTKSQYPSLVSHTGKRRR